MSVLDTNAQMNNLRQIQEGGGYGVLVVIARPGDVAFAASPVPELVGYEFVCVSPEHTFDVWKDGAIELANISLAEVKEFIRARTPEWLFDKSAVTEAQQHLLHSWLLKFEHRYRIELLKNEHN